MTGLGTFDLVVVGGGVNGAGIARDAQGRGLSTLLVEKDDLAQGTSSRSGKLVHGGLRYLEYYEFRLVREALIEREVLLRAAPHIVWPMRFVLPHSPEQRPGCRNIDLRRDPEGRPIKDQFTRAFEYSDCWVDDARLVVLNALDAKERGARVLTRTALLAARREGDGWTLTLEKDRTARARALVNAAGPWVENVLRAAGANSTKNVRLVKGSHIVTRKFWRGDHAYLLQNADKRVIFVNPYEGDLALIGTTDIPYAGRPEDVAADEDEIAYLLRVLKRYFADAPDRDGVIETFSGVRPLFDDRAQNASAVTRDYVFDIDAPPGSAPILSIFGGKITTFRKLAEHALDKLRPFFASMKGPWTNRAPLPGGELGVSSFDAFVDELRRRYAWLPESLLLGYARRYGSRVDELLAGATSPMDLGRSFGAGMTEREATFLVEREWAMSAADILERRTKCGLHMTAEERGAFKRWFAP